MAIKRYSKYKVDNSKKAKDARTVYDEHIGKTIKFASNIEKKYYDTVIVPGFKSGAILDYDLQRKYVLQEKFRHNGEAIRAIEYLADYWVKYADGHEEVRDTKGAGFLIDTVAAIKRKLFYYKYPDVDFAWITWSKETGWIIWDEYIKLKRKEKKEKKQNGI